MEPLTGLSKGLIVLGVMLIAIGSVIYLAGKFSMVGRLPGDIFFKKGNFTFYFPLATSILVSVIATILLNIFGRK